MKLLEPHHAQQIEVHLARVLDAHLDAPGLRPFKRMLCDYVMAGGKRVRPQLAAWTYQLASGSSELNDVVLDVAAGWELFHAFLLVHDDIIDESGSRRGQKALHVQLASLDSDSVRFGTNLGIVAGDLLFSAAMCLWHGLDALNAQTHRELLRLFSRVACTTGFGQAIDICASHLPMSEVDQATLLREYHWKTAAYTFEGPMLSGAILAGLGVDARAAISRYALALGQAYQLQNDLHDLARPADEGCDLAQGKRTITLLHHRDGLDGDGRAALDARLDAITLATGAGGNGTGGNAAGCAAHLALAEVLRGEVLAGDATARTRSTIASLLNDAGEAADDAAFSATIRASLSTLLTRLRDTYFSA